MTTFDSVSIPFTVPLRYVSEQNYLDQLGKTQTYIKTVEEMPLHSSTFNLPFKKFLLLNLGFFNHFFTLVMIQLAKEVIAGKPIGWRVFVTCVQLSGVRSELENIGQFSNGMKVVMGFLKPLFLTSKD